MFPLKEKCMHFLVGVYSRFLNHMLALSRSGLQGEGCVAQKKEK